MKDFYSIQFVYKYTNHFIFFFVLDEWMKINIEWPIKRWFGNHDLSHLLQITCESCDISGIEEIISVNKNYRPFIMIDTQNRQTKSRQKRNINCSNGVTECCREKLYISFADIGWDNWILQPKGYDAYFCRGSCSSVASVAQAASHHSSLLVSLSDIFFDYISLNPKFNFIIFYFILENTFLEWYTKASRSSTLLYCQTVFLVAVGCCGF